MGFPHEDNKYQIEKQKKEIEALQKTVLRLIACLAVELGSATAKSLIHEVHIED